MQAVFTDNCRAELIRKYKEEWVHFKRGVEYPNSEIGMPIEEFYDNKLMPLVKEFIEWRCMHQDPEGMCKKVHVTFKLGQSARNGKPVKRWTCAYVVTPMSIGALIRNGKMNMTINLGSVVFHEIIKQIGRKGFSETIDEEGLESLLGTIAHEFVHIAQYSEGRLEYEHYDKFYRWKEGDEESCWDNSKELSFEKYKAQPWEAEAFSRAPNIVKGWNIRKSLLNNTQ